MPDPLDAAVADVDWCIEHIETTRPQVSGVLLRLHDVKRVLAERTLPTVAVTEARVVGLWAAIDRYADASADLERESSVGEPSRRVIEHCDNARTALEATITTALRSAGVGVVPSRDELTVLIERMWVGYSPDEIARAVLDAIGGQPRAEA